MTQPKRYTSVNLGKGPREKNTHGETTSLLVRSLSLAVSEDPTMGRSSFFFFSSSFSILTADDWWFLFLFFIQLFLLSSPCTFHWISFQWFLLISFGDWTFSLRVAFKFKLAKHFSSKSVVIKIQLNHFSMPFLFFYEIKLLDSLCKLNI